MRPRILWLLAVLIAVTPARETSPQEPVGQYLVKLRDRPVAAQLAARDSFARQKLPLAGPEAVSYRDQLLAKQAAVKRWVEALPQAEVQAQMDTVFNGLVVSLRAGDASAVQQHPDVAEVIPSLRYEKLLDAALPLARVPEGWSHPSIGGEDHAGEGIRIAVIDSGMDAGHPMLQDPSLDPPDGYPRFTEPATNCENSDQRFTNSKVIVARNYVRLLGIPDPNCDAEDRDGHGTFIAGLAAGRRAQSPQASLAGVAPKAFLGSYKVFGTPGINDASTTGAIVKALDDAVKDDMDIINLSLGLATDRLPTLDPLATAVAAAVEAGVTVVVAAGNGGGTSAAITTPGIAPEAITVGSSTSSRSFANLLRITAPEPLPSGTESMTFVSGNGPRLQTLESRAPLSSVAAVDRTALACSPLPPVPLRGKTLLIRRGCCPFSTKVQHAFQAGALAVIFYNDQAGGAAFSFDVGSARQIPAIMIGNREGIALEEFLPTARGEVRASVEAGWRRIPAAPNRRAGFSSSGPSTDFEIKPDLLAPGTSLLSAAQRSNPSGKQYDPSGFGFAEGTSFSAALVSGAAALVKQAAPRFQPAQIKSALVNSAARVPATSVVAQGNGLLDLEAALNAPAVVAPVSMSFGTHPPGSPLHASSRLQITNTGPAADTFTVSAVRTTGSEALTVSASPARFVLARGETISFAVNADSSASLTGTVEGYLSIRGESSQKTITVSYWGNFLQPAVNPGGFVNAASFSFGSSSVAPGSLVSIFGADLRSSEGPKVRMGRFQAPVFFSGPNQINVQVPFELVGRSTADVVVQVNGVSSAGFPVSLAPAAPGLFTLDRSGRGYGAIVHNADFRLVTPDNPARPGEVLTLFATGLGDVFPGVLTGAAAVPSPLSVSTPSSTPAVIFGGIAAPLKFSGLAPCLVGVYQVDVEVPAGTPPGTQTLTLISNGIASNPVQLAVGQRTSRALRRAARSQELRPSASLCSLLTGMTWVEGTG